MDLVYDDINLLLIFLKCNLLFMSKIQKQPYIHHKQHIILHQHPINDSAKRRIKTLENQSPTIP